MTDKTDEVPLTSEYWNHHRNSLLFSSALFLSCLIVDASGFNIFGITFGTLGAKAVTLLLLATAAYCFVALFLEWREQAWRGFRRLTGHHATSLAELDSRTQQLRKVHDRYIAAVDSMEQSAGRFVNSQERLDGEAIDQAYVAHHRQAVEDWRIVNPGGGPTGPISPENQARLERNRQDIEEKSRVDVERGRERAPAVHFVMGQIGQRIQDEVTALAAEAHMLNSQLVALSQYKRGRMIALKCALAGDCLRLHVVGIWIPGALFVIAAAHGIGRLWWAPFPSWTLATLNGMH